MATVQPFSGRIGTIEVDHFREMFGFWVEWNVLLHPGIMNPYLVWRAVPQFLEGPALLTWKEFCTKHAAEITEWRQYWAPRQYVPDVSGVAAYMALQEAEAAEAREAAAGKGPAKEEEETEAEDELLENVIPDGPVPPFNPTEELFAVFQREYGEVRSDKLVLLRDFCQLPGESLREAYTRLADLSKGVLSERQAIQYWLNSLDEELLEMVKGMLTEHDEDRTLTKVFRLCETARADKLQRSIMEATLTLGDGLLPNAEAA